MHIYARFYFRVPILFLFIVITVFRKTHTAPSFNTRTWRDVTRLGRGASVKQLTNIPIQWQRKAACIYIYMFGCISLLQTFNNACYQSPFRLIHPVHTPIAFANTFDLHTLRSMAECCDTQSPTKQNRHSHDKYWYPKINTDQEELYIFSYPQSDISLSGLPLP